MNNDAEKQAITDSDIALGMIFGDKEYLRLFIEKYGGRIKAYLIKYYGNVLHPQEIDEAFNNAVYNVWRFADRYDESKGSLGSWCIRIAQRSAQSILRRELDFRSRHDQYDHVIELSDNPPDEEVQEPVDANKERLINDLHCAIENLPPLQKAIIKADLASGDGNVANAGRLAIQYGTDKNSIYVSRLKAKDNLRKEMIQRGHKINTVRALK